MLSDQDQSRLQSSGAVPMKRLFDRLGTIWLRLFQLNAWERPRRSLRPFCSYLATTQASRLEPNCKWTAEALILTCLKGINMNGEKDKLIRDFMNAFGKKDVKVLEEFFHPNVVFRNYGDKEVRLGGAEGESLYFNFPYHLISPFVENSSPNLGRPFFDCPMISFHQGSLSKKR